SPTQTRRTFTLPCRTPPHLLPAMLKRSEALPKVKEWCVVNSSFFLFAFFLFCAFLLLLVPLLSGQPSAVHVHPVPLTPSCSFQPGSRPTSRTKRADAWPSGTSSTPTSPSAAPTTTRRPTMPPSAKSSKPSSR